jgi:cephalosporin hydroxylase
MRVMVDPPPPRYLVSHHVHRWHNLLVPPGPDGRVTLAHRATGERRAVDGAAWDALARAARRPATEEECAAALAAAGADPARAAGEVRALIEARFLVEPAADLWPAYAPDLGPAPPPAALASDRLRWSRDAIDPHALWLYPRWLGFPVLQLPSDLVWMQMLLAEVRPAFLIETGLFRGGGAIFYASIFALLGSGQVVAIESRLDPAVGEAIRAHPLGARVTIVEGDSADPAVVARVSDLVGGSGPHVVALDSDHSAGHVRAELEAYAPLVDASGKIVVFDTSMSLCPRWAADSPHHAVRGFLAAHAADWRISPWAGASFVTAAEDGILERLPPPPG